jgi:hypothetical protein
LAWRGLRPVFFVYLPNRKGNPDQGGTLRGSPSAPRLRSARGFTSRGTWIVRGKKGVRGRSLMS